MGKGETKMIRAGGRTYFFDLKKAKTGQAYLVLTESRWTEEGAERQRQRIVVFPEQALEFAANVGELAGKMA